MDKPILNALLEIRGHLKNSSSEEARAATRKFVPTSIKVYGVRLPIINDLARQYKKGGFDLAIKLWRSGFHEEQLLAAKILGLAARENPERTIALLMEFSTNITDWAVCDTLATQSIKSIAAKQETKIFEAAQELLESSEMWQRRLGIVLLTHYANVPAKQQTILAMLSPLRTETEHYIKKALAWIDRDIAKSKLK